jgi:enoyl-[acyl-carrier-protein] reductase (NADH)
MGIMQGKTILVTGVLTDHSIAFSVAKLIQEQMVAYQNLPQF